MTSDPYSALKQYNQWVLYNRATKHPLNPATLLAGDLSDPNNQMSYDEAMARYSDNIGVGFYFTKSDPFFFLDIDTEKELYTGKAFGGWTKETTDILAQFPGALVESSMSGLGLHVIGTCPRIPPHGCRHEHKELYSHSRYCALTFNNASGDASIDQTAGITTLVASYFQPGATTGPTGTDWTTEPRADWCGPMDDAELIQAFLTSKPSFNQMFGSTATNATLWNADPEALAVAFPPDDPSIKSHNGSSADLSLATRLMWITGCDCERTERLMWESELVRDKWENRPGYVTDTVRTAYMRHGDRPVYNNQHYAIKPTERTTGDTMRGVYVMGPDMFQKYFNGMVYVASMSKIFTGDEDVPLAGPQLFNDLYSRACTFQMTLENEKPTRKAWDAFCNSAVFKMPYVRSTCFKPQFPYGAVVETGRTSKGDPICDVNICAMPKVQTREGDPEPFLDLVRRILADEQDQQILLAYFAACVQYPGIKFKWAPVLQGEEGNGKSFLLRFLRHAMGGKYIHTLASHELVNGFNAWLGRSILVFAEDLHIEPGKRRATMEILKQMITGDEQSITYKGIDAESKTICANFIFTTNFKDTIQKSEGSRRYCMLFTEQQCFDDIERTGLTNEYFNKLGDWVDNGHGLEIVSGYLRDYKIPVALDPSKGAQRAPDTSSTNDAITYGRSYPEQLIMEAVQLKELGFRGDFISTRAVSTLFKDNHINRSPQAMCESLKKLGYIPVPSLGGNVIRTGMSWDGISTRLYALKNSLASKLPKDRVKENYVDAQFPAGEDDSVYIGDLPENGGLRMISGVK
jgi:hypothetical protein